MMRPCCGECRRALLAEPNSWVNGNLGGRCDACGISSDYACGLLRNGAYPEIAQVLETTAMCAFVSRNCQVLGPSSELAARMPSR